jgi:hypothetical protein
VEQADLLKYAVACIESNDIPYLLAGSLASGVYGEPRHTLDIDIVIDLKMSQIDAVCTAFPPPEFYISRSAAIEAIETGRQFNVLNPPSGNKIDFMISRRDSWGRSQLQRRRREMLVPGCEGYAAAPEDIIISKLIYFQEGRSEKHIRDIVAMMDSSASLIDKNYLQKWIDELGLANEWQHVVEQFEAQ